MQMQIQIIKVGKEENKGTYKAIQVTYKNLSQGGKVEGKNVVNFGDYAHMFPIAATWQEDQIISIRNEKIANPKTGKEYWTWVDVLDGDAEPSPETPKRNEVEKTTVKSTKQQWVPDEVRQRLIVRQSALERAILFEAPNAPSLEDVLKTAERFVDWVFEVGAGAQEAPAKRGRKAKVVEETAPEVD
jgi:hypothetical protein